MNFRRVSSLALGYGSLGFGALSFLSPRGLARAMGDSPSVVPALGVRDAIIGTALVRSGGRAALTARLISDLTDAIRLAKRNRVVAVGALVFALWAAAALASSDRD
jgi:hypothetical protein